MNNTEAKAVNDGLPSRTVKVTKKQMELYPSKILTKM